MGGDVVDQRQHGSPATLQSQGGNDWTFVTYALHEAIARIALGGLDRDRLIRRSLRLGRSQTAIAAEVGISQARISQIAASGVDEVPDGFSGASPLEIAQRYAAKDITRAQAIDELGRWPYASSVRPNEYDDAWEPGPNTWADVEVAHRRGFIDDEMYEKVLDLSINRASQ